MTQINRPTCFLETWQVMNRLNECLRSVSWSTCPIFPEGIVIWGLSQHVCITKLIGKFKDGMITCIYFYIEGITKHWIHFKTTPVSFFRFLGLFLSETGKIIIKISLLPSLTHLDGSISHVWSHNSSPETQRIDVVWTDHHNFWGRKSRLQEQSVIKIIF